MSCRLLPFAMLVSLVLTMAGGAQGAPEGFRNLEIGDSAPDFQLPGVDDKTYSLSDFSKAKLLLVVFTCNHCPTAQAYEPRLIKMHEDYRDKGLAIVAISPNDDAALRLEELRFSDVGDSFDDMKFRAKERQFPFPYLYDGETQKTSAAYGAMATPHVFLFDQARKLRYAGGIDNSEIKEPTSHDARNAIDALLAGKPVPVEKTRTFGCSTKWSDKREEVAKWMEKVQQEPVTLESIDAAGLAKLVKNETEDYLLINVWATWCGPCVAELPEFVTINRMYRGRNFRFVTISMDEADQKEDVLKQLKRAQVATTNYLSAITDRDELADVLDQEWQGPLPYTVLIAPGGKVVYRHNEPIKPLELRRTLVEFLGRTYASQPAKK